MHIQNSLNWLPLWKSPNNLDPFSCRFVTLTQLETFFKTLYSPLLFIRYLNFMLFIGQSGISLLSYSLPHLIKSKKGFAARLAGSRLAPSGCPLLQVLSLALHPPYPHLWPLSIIPFLIVGLLYWATDENRDSVLFHRPIHPKPHYLHPLLAVYGFYLHPTLILYNVWINMYMDSCIAGSCISYIRLPQSQKTMLIC